jgi:hypothetical protein
VVKPRITRANARTSFIGIVDHISGWKSVGVFRHAAA